MISPVRQKRNRYNACVTRYRHRVIQRARQRLGGCCEECGVSGMTHALHFHHRAGARGATPWQRNTVWLALQILRLADPWRVYALLCPSCHRAADALLRQAGVLSRRHFRWCRPTHVDFIRSTQGGLSYSAIARMLGISHQTASRIARGETHANV
jgi:5-methylcytosine-specific restriction endonuclease McrA